MPETHSQPQPAATSSAITALRHRAHSCLIALALMPIGRRQQQFDQWHGFARALRELESGIGDQLAAKDARSGGYLPASEFERAIEVVGADLESLSIRQILERLTALGFEVPDEAVTGLDTEGAPIRANLVARQPCGLGALRLLMGEHRKRGIADHGPRLTDDLETLTGLQIQQRFAAQGVEMTADFAAQVQIDAVAEAEHRATAVLVQPNDEHPIAAVDCNDGTDTHPQSVATGSAQ
jgi:hypothetical protein